MQDIKWNKRYEELVAFREKFGDVDVTEAKAREFFQDNEERGIPFFNWVQIQRQAKETMKQERRDKLDALSFIWRKYAVRHTWDDNYKAVKAAKAANQKLCPRLYKWLHKQSVHYRAKGLNADKVKKLEDIGINLSKRPANSALEENQALKEENACLKLLLLSQLGIGNTNSPSPLNETKVTQNGKETEKEYQGKVKENENFIAKVGFNGQPDGTNNPSSAGEAPKEGVESETANTKQPTISQQQQYVRCLRDDIQRDDSEAGQGDESDLAGNDSFSEQSQSLASAAPNDEDTEKVQQLESASHQGEEDEGDLSDIQKDDGSEQVATENEDKDDDCQSQSSASTKVTIQTQTSDAFWPPKRLPAQLDAQSQSSTLTPDMASHQGLGDNHDDDLSDMQIDNCSVQVEETDNEDAEEIQTEFGPPLCG
jgi:Helicase associated domain